MEFCKQGFKALFQLFLHMCWSGKPAQNLNLRKQTVIVSVFKSIAQSGHLFFSFQVAGRGDLAILNHKMVFFKIYLLAHVVFTVRGWHARLTPFKTFILSSSKKFD